MTPDGAPRPRPAASAPRSTSRRSAALDAAAAELRDAFPDPWLRAYSVKANDVPAIIARLGAAGLGGERRLVRRVGRGHGGPASATTGSRSRASARPPPTSGRPCGPRGTGDPLRWVAVESPEELDALLAIARRAGLGDGGAPAARRPAPPQPGRDARDPRRPGRRSRDLEVRHDRDRAHGGRRAGSRPTARSGRAASTSTSARSWARWTRGATPSAAAWRCSRSIGAGREGFDTFDVGGGFPVGDPGTIPTPAHFGREVQPLLDGAAARSAARTPGRRARPVPGRRAPGGSWRACSTSASGPARSGSWSSTPA